MNKLDWIECSTQVYKIWFDDDDRLPLFVPSLVRDLYEQGDSPEEAYRKYQEGEV